LNNVAKSAHSVTIASEAHELRPLHFFFAPTANSGESLLTSAISGSILAMPPRASWRIQSA
jgi:hypothetical protein